MAEPQAWLNGRLIPFSAAAVPITDAGFAMGTTVAERLRTFAGRLFRLDAHLERLDHSLAIVDVEPGLSRAELTTIAEDLAARNHRLLAPGDDLGLGIFVTPGSYYATAGEAIKPTVGIYSYPLPFDHWADKYERGQSLVTTDIEQVSEKSWPRDLKCRSRVHYYLADHRAAQSEPGARALLLDHDGYVTEASTANIIIHRADEGLITPPREKVLPGITLATVEELARELSLPMSSRDLTPHDVATADEVLLTSTSICVLPVVRYNGRPISAGQPGAVYRKLLAAWNRLTGIDIAEQARRFAKR